MAQRYAWWRRGQFGYWQLGLTGFVVMDFLGIYDIFFCDSKDDTLLLRSYTRTKGATRFSIDFPPCAVMAEGLFYDGNLYEMPSHRGTVLEVSF